MATTKRKKPLALPICFDRIVPADMRKKAVKRSARLALMRGKFWQVGQTINCKFMEGTVTQQLRTEEIAHEWEQYANIKFRFASSGDTEIRIAFQQGQGSWSAVGTDALVTDLFPADGPTMNFGWLTDDTDMTEWRRVVLHEFGHALGAIHEHQSPSEGLDWNTAVVYDCYGGPPNNWSREQVDQNVLSHYSKEQTNLTSFDRDSIMLYSFPGELFVNGQSTPFNTELSQLDKAFMKRQYPAG